MVPADRGYLPASTTTTVVSAMLPARWMRAVLGVALTACLVSSPPVALAGAAVPPAGTGDNTLVFGLTATELVVATVVGAGAGAAVAIASGNAIAGASVGFGTLAAIYVAHLAVEAIVVGGFYYWWPGGPADETASARATAIMEPGKDRDAIAIPLRLAPRD
jgi:hypothetical protein